MDYIRVKRIQYTKFFIVTLDCILTWTKHITEIENKISKNIGVISRARNVVNTKELQTLNVSPIFPFLNYEVLLWGIIFKVD